MRKNKFSVLGMLAMALGLVSAGCDPNGGDEPYTGPKSITITDITVSFTGAAVLLVGDGINRASIAAKGTGSISNGSITVAMKNQDETDWSEVGSYILVLEDPSDRTNETYAYTDGGTIALPNAKVSITKASTTFSFNKFTKINPLGG